MSRVSEPVIREPYVSCLSAWLLANPMLPITPTCIFLHYINDFPKPCSMLVTAEDYIGGGLCTRIGYIRCCRLAEQITNIL